MTKSPRKGSRTAPCPARPARTTLVRGLWVAVVVLKAKPLRDSKSEIQFNRKKEENKIHAILQKKKH